MLDVFHIAKPQKCDIQTFYGGSQYSIGANSRGMYTWQKPRGVSHVYMLLIGGGGSGDGSTPGASGAVTVWYGAAQNVPNVLSIAPSGYNQNNSFSGVYFYNRSSTPTLLISASTGTFSSAGPATTANAFSASGFYKSTVGTTLNGAASGTTFLCAGGSASSFSANYGYSTTGSGASGYFLFQPIIVTSGNNNNSNPNVYGCGGPATGVGGSGLVLIASW